MRALRLAVAGLCGALTAAQALAAEPQRFDLVCDLTETSSLKPGVSVAITRRLSIDLTARRWRFLEPGADVRRLGRVNAAEISLGVVDDGASVHTTVIDRKSWRWTGHATLTRPIHAEGSSQGVCRLAPFTPFPMARA